jgi:hypothetical protein
MDFLPRFPSGTKITILAYPFSGADAVHSSLLHEGHDCKLVHDIEEIGNSDVLLCVVRNYKECIKDYYRDVLDLNSRPLNTELDRLSFLIGRCRHSSYLSILLHFDQYNGTKQLLYYEDLFTLG